MRIACGLLVCALGVCVATVGGGGGGERRGGITFVITGEQLGRLAPCGCTEEQVGGLARRARVVSEVRRQTGRDVVLLDNGGLVPQGGRQQEIKHALTLLAMDEMGYDAVGVGMKDLGIGLSTLEAQAEGWGFGVLSSNLRRTNGGYPFERQRLIPLESGRTVGVFALMGRLFADEVARVAQGLEVADPIETAGEVVGKLRADSDVIVLLSHAPIEETREIVRAVKGIDLAVTGYLMDKPLEEAERIGETLIVGTGLDGKWVVRVDLDLDEGGNVTGKGYEPIHLSGDFEEDEMMLEMLDDYRLQVAEERLIERVPRAPMGGLKYVGSHACLRCHRPQFRKWETVPHATALVSLEENGFDQDPECVVCHVVGLEDEGGFRSAAQTPDLASVGCEACHGAGGRHMANVLAPYKRPDEQTCRTCHDPDNSPTFNFDEYYPKIKHLDRILKALRLEEGRRDGESDGD